MPAEPSQTAPSPLATMLISAAFWGFIAFDALDWGTWYLAWWVPVEAAALDTFREIAAGGDHPYLGWYMTALLLIGAALMALQAVSRGVLGEAFPLGRVGVITLGWISVLVIADNYLWYAIEAATYALGGDEALIGEKPEYEVEQTLAHMPAEFFWSVIGAPVFEEMAFRGLMLGVLLARGWNSAVAVTVTAAAFAITHQQYYLPSLVYVFIGGLVFGWLRLASGGLLAPMLAHGAMNGWIVLDEWATLLAA